MPPKAKFTKEQITQAAFDIVRAEGLQALTARALGQKLGSSARPIFTIFQSMEDVQQEVFDAAKAYYYSCTMGDRPQEIGVRYVQFAIKEPKLFQLLFMKEQANIPDMSAILSMPDEHFDMIFASIEKDFGISSEDAQRFYKHLWIYAHGIASLCATKMCTFSEDEIRAYLYEVGESVLRKMWAEDHK